MTLTTVKCLGESLLEQWLYDDTKVEKQITEDLISLIGDISLSVAANSDFYESEGEDYNECFGSNYSEIYYFKLNDDNKVVLCNKFDEWISRLEYESQDMCSIIDIANDISIELSPHIRLPKYTHFLNYLADKNYYRNIYDGETLEYYFTRQQNILERYRQPNEISV